MNFQSARRRNEAMRWHRRLTITQQMEIQTAIRANVSDTVHLVVHDNRRPNRDILINRLCIRIRRIDTAVRTVREVDCAAKICSCLHVMDSDVSVERHPEIHR